MKERIVVRAMSRDDAADVARLAGELGYPADAATVTRRMEDVLDTPHAAAVVAERDGRVVGWAHVEEKRTLVEVHSAQLMALVVEEASRGEGVGAALLAAAESWAGERGIGRMLVATRVTRERAHAFYVREDYVMAKTSHIFEKRLA
jgi:GNAT superfamily N-acetyltransferase